jgi:hypothetical protein
MKHLSEQDILLKARSIIRKRYELEHPDWDNEIVVDKTTKSNYITAMVKDVEEILAREGF